MHEILMVIIARILSWPVATVLLCLIFRRNISNLFTRATHVALKHGETSFEASATGSASEQAEQAERPKPESLSTAIILTAQDVPALPEVDEAARQAAIDFGKGIPVVQAGEEQIRFHLARLNFHLSSDVTTEILIRNLAYCQALAQAEALYRLIFGSQIVLLKFLNTNGAKADVELRPFYEEARRKVPKYYAEYPYESWRDFLLNQQVIVHDSLNDTYGINIHGRSFLIWIVSQGLSEEKAG